MGVCDHTKNSKEEINFKKEDDKKEGKINEDIKTQNNSKENITNKDNATLNNIIQNNSNQDNEIQDNASQNNIKQDSINQDNISLNNTNQDTSSQDNTSQNNANQDNEIQDNTNKNNRVQGLESNIEYNNKKEGYNKQEVNNKVNEEDKGKEEKNNSNDDGTKIEDNKKENNNNKEENNDKNSKDENRTNEENNNIIKDEDSHLSNIKKINEKIKTMKNAFCKIMLNNNELAKGVFCIIPFPNKNNPILAVIINSFIIKENNIKGKLLSIKLNENNQPFSMQIDNNTLIYEDKDNNIIIVEMKNYYPNFNFFEIDDDLNKDKCEDIYNKKYILLIDYSFKENNKLEFNFEYILGFNNIDRIISENENKYKDGIIINSLNNKIIGIINKKSAFLLNKSIINFYEKYKNVIPILNNNNLEYKIFQPVFHTNQIIPNNNINTKINSNINTNINSNFNTNFNNINNNNFNNINNNIINNNINSNINNIINTNINNINNSNINNIINNNINHINKSNINILSIVI